MLHSGSKTRAQRAPVKNQRKATTARRTVHTTAHKTTKNVKSKRATSVKSFAMTRSKRSFADEAGAPELQELSDEQKDAYNQWLFAKTKPVFAQTLATLFVVFGIAPPRTKTMPTDDASTLIVDALLNHGIIRPISDTRPVIENSDQVSVDQIWSIITTTGLLSPELRKKLQPGSSNVDLAWHEGTYQTDPYTKDIPEANPDDFAEDGQVYTVIQSVLDACQQAGLYDVQYFQKKPEDVELYLPIQPPSETAATPFNNIRLVHSTHEEGSEVFNVTAQWMEENVNHDENGQPIKNVTLNHLLDVLSSVYREDVVSTLQDDEEILYVEATENGLATDDHLNLLQDVIWRCAFQQHVYQEFMSSENATEYDYVLMNLPEMYTAALDHAPPASATLQSVDKL